MKVLNYTGLQNFWTNIKNYITVHTPTKTSDLTNDSNFVDTSNSAVASGITSAKVTSYDSHVADTDIHVTTADKAKWNNGVTQSYVFRYSSTALVASSTNSNTLLDNTDNLKVGDKVIDSSGVLFSITAIDTANSTFTIGTALVDLAQDSDVVHKSGNETITGEKTFNDLHIVSYGTQYKGARNAYILPEFSAGYSGLAITTLGFSQTLKIGNFVLDANNKPTLDTSKGYIQVATGESNGVNACVIEPRNSTSSSLGASANKWSKIYGTEYYYGSNNVEFSNKFVTTDTAQTISGVKTFSDNPLVGNGNTNITISNRQITANGLASTTGNHAYSFMQLQAKVTYADSSSPIIGTVVLETNEDAYTDGKSSAFYPNSNNFTNLGKSGKRWANVYATNYYYGLSETEFSTKFVTTDTNQTVSGDKTFTNNVKVKNTDVTRGSTTGSGYKAVTYTDSNDNELSRISVYKVSNGSTSIEFKVSSTDNADTVISSSFQFFVSKNGNKVINPTTSDEIALGRSSNRWSDVVTVKVNGLEPSSLSLPSDRSARVDISSYFIYTGNNATNNYSVPTNGYIFLKLDNINQITCYSVDSSSITNYAQTYTRPSDGVLYITFPVRKNDNFRTIWNTGSSVSVESAYFIPCQGNV